MYSDGRRNLAGVVYDDHNANGHRDSGESGIKGIRMQLRNTAGKVFATVHTDHNGHYRWPGLPADVYIVTAANPPNGRRTEDPDGVNTPDTATIDLRTQSKENEDFGYDRK